MKNKEQLAEEYAEENNSAYMNDYYGFLEGYNSAEKRFKKKIKDKYNHYNSKLKEATKTKLDRRDRTEYIIKLEAKVELLKELMR